MFGLIMGKERRIVVHEAGKGKLLRRVLDSQMVVSRQGYFNHKMSNL